MKRGHAIVAFAAAAALLLSGCAAGQDGPRAVNTEEAQLLAITRFQNFDVGSRAFQTELTADGAELHLQGWVDYASHLGYTSVTGDGFAPQALLWTQDAVGLIAAAPDADGNPPLPIVAGDDPGWTSRDLDPTGSRLDALLAAIGALGADRPENPLLLQQTGALWLRTDEVEGTAVTVFAAPPSDQVPDATVSPEDSNLRLWVDASGGLRVAEVRVGTDWVRVDFPDGDAPTLALPESTP